MESKNNRRDFTLSYDSMESKNKRRDFTLSQDFDGIEKQKTKLYSIIWFDEIEKQKTKLYIIETGDELLIDYSFIPTFDVIPASLLAAAMLDEVAGYEGRNMPLDALWGNICKLRELRNAEAGVGLDAIEDHLLAGG